MFAKGLIVQYEKKGELKQSAMDAWNHHEKFTEVFLENGDTISDEEIIQIIEDND